MNKIWVKPTSKNHIFSNLEHWVFNLCLSPQFSIFILLSLASSFFHPFLSTLKYFPKLTNMLRTIELTSFMILQVGVLDRQPQEVQNTLVLGAGAHMLADLVPVVLVQLQGLQQQQSLLFRPVSCSRGSCLASHQCWFSCVPTFTDCIG